MSELEITVQALTLCVPKDVFDKAMETVRNTAASVPARPVPDVDLLIADMLKELGCPAHILGYGYLRTAIRLAVKDDRMINAITKSLYPEVAKLHNTTASRVERAIRHAVETTWDRGDIDVLYRYFGNSINLYKAKPTNSEFIARLAHTILDQCR